MVSIDIPKSHSEYTADGTPHLTINHEATVDLDSTNAFEGPEKLLEVWFCPSPDALPPSAAPNGLKSVPADTWKDMLDVVNCKVLSIVESEHVDAYLLSESSMFVSPHKLILKTCGTTTLLYGLPRILEIAALSAGFPHSVAVPSKGITAAATPYRVFYSRKNFLFPDRQRGPHRNWKDEVKYLDEMFLNGSAYMVGKMNGEHWYLYLTGPGTALTPPLTPDREAPRGAGTETRSLNVPAHAPSMGGMKPNAVEDETLEVLMTDLDEENAKQFYLEHATVVAEAQYFQQGRKFEHSKHNIGISNGDGFKGWNGNVAANGGSQYSSDDFDVFSNGTANGEDGFPEELTTEGHALGTVVSKNCGLSEVYPSSQYPDARIDAYLFTPCGFSANGVVPVPTGENGKSATHYFTVHVTPEPHCSYASFETNVPGRHVGRDTADVVEHVVNIFRPGRFSVTFFETKPSLDDVVLGGDRDETLREIKALERNAARRSSRMENIKGYRRVDRIVHDLDGYDLVFRYYERNDWKGGAPRLGEVDF